MLKSALSLGDEFRPSPSTALSTPVSLAASNTPGHSQNIDTQTESRQQQSVEQIAQRGTNPPDSIQDIIGAASERYGIDEALIKAVIKAESNFNPNAVSHAGAQGLMQLMPGTARGLGVADSFNAEQNVMAGTRFLKDMLKRYNGNLDSALAAYNWGPGNVDRKGTSVLPQETKAYLAKVKGYYSQYTG
jgi:soluble lytic murein transglycosylase-like protein